MPGLLLGVQLAWAEIPTGRKQVWLETGDGRKVEIGALEIGRKGDEYSFDFALERSSFSDQFLSMRPFKCIDGEPMYCHLVYPYAKADTIVADDFVNLEYEFLFILRSATEYGIDPYHGRYFVLRLENGIFSGVPRAVDLNLLAAPPEAGATRPITRGDLDSIEIEAERFPRLLID